MATKKPIIGVDTNIRVLVSLIADEDSDYKWSAVALEMNIWGFGNSEQEALIDLEELIQTQIEFATGRGEHEILDHPAEKKWFDLWREAEEAKTKRRSQMKKFVKTIPLPSQQTQVEAEVCCYKAA